MKFNIFLLSILGLCWPLLASATQAPEEEFIRTIDKNYPLSAGGLVELANQYGRIDIRSWDKNEVAIKVRIVVQAGSQKEAETIFDRIQVSFSNTSQTVRAQTDISSSSSRSWWGWGSGSGSNSNDFKIYYEVRMPAKAKLYTQARYCDVAADVLRASSTFDVKYGKLKVESLYDKSDITVAYGDIDLQNAAAAQINLSYGNLKLNTATDLNLYARYSEVQVIGKVVNFQVDSRYTKVRIETADKLDFTAGYGELVIRKVGTLRGNSNYTDYEIGHVSNAANIETDYGDVEISHLAANFREVIVRSTYSDLNIRVDKTAAYTLDAQTRYADLDYPSSMNVSLNEKTGNSIRVKGSQSGSGNGLLNLSASYGDIDLRTVF